MYCLGRRDLLEPPVAMFAQGVVSNDNGKPVKMPAVGDDNVVVCGIKYASGIECLTVCKNLYEMENQYAFFMSHAIGNEGLYWYIADRDACEQALNNRMASSM